MSVTPFRRISEPQGEVEMGATDATGVAFDGSTIFRRTDAGNAEFRNRASLLPQRLKSILLLVDSRTTVEKFVASLRVYGDVSDLFQVLLDMGLIEPVNPSGAVRNAAVQIRPEPVPAAVLVERDLAARPRFEDEYGPPTQAHEAAAHYDQDRKKAQPPPLASYLPSAGQPQRPPAPLPAFNSAANYQSGNSTIQRTTGSPVNNDLLLRRAVNMLTDWVPDLFPNDAMDVMFELDKCRSRDEFALTMNDLFPVMQKVWGPVETKRRLAQLQSILSGKL
jgi:hypothetical protein